MSTASHWRTTADIRMTGSIGHFGLSTGFCRSLREGRETENQA